MVTVQVRFGQFGMREPERERERIAPLLKAITRSPERNCEV